jgi:hypothetical protein
VIKTRLDVLIYTKMLVITRELIAVSAESQNISSGLPTEAFY